MESNALRPSRVSHHLEFVTSVEFGSVFKWGETEWAWQVVFSAEVMDSKPPSKFIYKHEDPC